MTYNHPEGNSYIKLKEEEVWLNEYQNCEHASRRNRRQSEPLLKSKRRFR